MLQATPVAAGIAVGVAAYAGKALVEMALRMRNAPPKMRQFYKVPPGASRLTLHPMPLPCKPFAGPEQHVHKVELLLSGLFG